MRRYLAGSLGAVMLMLLSSVGPASGATPPTAPGVRVIQVDDQFSSLTITFDAPIPAAAANSLKQQLTSSGTVARSTPTAGTPSATPAAAAPYIQMWCGTKWSTTDAKGQFSMERICENKQVRWWYRFDPALVAIAVGNVSESGLAWWKNGVAQPSNAPHTVPANYWFHGTMSPLNNKDWAQAQDFFKYKVNVAGQTGTATQTVAVQYKAYPIT